MLSVLSGECDRVIGNRVPSVGVLPRFHYIKALGHCISVLGHRTLLGWRRLPSVTPSWFHSSSWCSTSFPLSIGSTLVLLMITHQADSSGNGFLFHTELFTPSSHGWDRSCFGHSATSGDSSIASLDALCNFCLWASKLIAAWSNVISKIRTSHIL